LNRNVAIDSNNCSGTIIGIYTPPACGNGNAVKVTQKRIVDGQGSPVTISGITWDRNASSDNAHVLWGAHGNNVYEINIGAIDNSNAVATFRFNHNRGGLSLIDGLAWDPEPDPGCGARGCLWLSPDVNTFTHQFGLPGGNFIRSVRPTQANGQFLGAVSGTAVGAPGTLYTVHDGLSRILHINKDGSNISDFGNTSGRGENAVCDPLSCAANGFEVLAVKDAFGGLFEWIEVEEGTCPIPGEAEIQVAVDIKPQSCPNPLNCKEKGVLPVAILGTSDLDVTDVDPASVRLEGVPPLRSALEDVASPFSFAVIEDCDDCTTEGPDGFLDLTLKFDTQEVLAAIGIGPDDDKVCLVLTLTGELLDGTPIVGEDVVRILCKKKK